MRNTMKKFLVYAWCALGQLWCATDALDEKAHLISGQRQNIGGLCAETLLDKEQQVRVLYFPKDGQQYSAAFDVRGVKAYAGYGMCGHFLQLIQPLHDHVKDQFLMGYKVKKKQVYPLITAAQFDVRSAQLQKCDRKEFYSDLLRKFLQNICPRLYEGPPSRVRFHDGWQPLEACDFKKMLGFFRVFKWSIVREVDAASEKKKNTTIFIAVQGAGLLKGVLEWGVLTEEWVIERRTLLCQKVTGAMPDLHRTYTFSRAGYRDCINF